MPYADPEQQRHFQREWHARRRAEWIAANGPCAMCGGREDLEVDHVDPAAKVSHKVWSWSAERRAEELAKCQVLCKPCHDDKSRTEGGGTALRHGTCKRYQRGCRCPECRAAKAASRRPAT